ncbi:unnamed protein product [Thlaspi arvense]|uniref:Uncharacterized protein n=1 Tax=Thlaspi arvense TaxID=13288 RepID=A0AAU9SHC6_THLAR|nr:unnamed protein product [Thlaspi arvense]
MQRRWKELVELCFGPGDTSEPWCVIENVKFSNFRGKLEWYDTERRNWIDVEGLKYKDGRTIHLANHGGKLVHLRKEPGTTWSLVPGERRRRRADESPVPLKRRKYLHQRIQCELIKLEKRMGSSGLEIWGTIVWSKAVLSFPNSYEFLSCIITL